METKTIAISIIIAAVLIGGAVMFSSKTPPQPIDSVSVVGDKQIITITAKGGYFPRTITAKAGIPTTIRVKTQNTFDCSSALVIPGIGYRNNLPPSGETLIDVPAQPAGTSMRGLCSMGMYSFTINFN